MTWSWEIGLLVAISVLALVLALIAGWVRAAGASLPWLQPLAIAALLLAILTTRDDVGFTGWLLFGAIAAASVAAASVAAASVAAASVASSEPPQATTSRAAPATSDADFNFVRRSPIS